MFLNHIQIWSNLKYFEIIFRKHLVSWLDILNPYNLIEYIITIIIGSNFYEASIVDVLKVNFNLLGFAICGTRRANIIT